MLGLQSIKAWRFQAFLCILFNRDDYHSRQYGDCRPTHLWWIQGQISLKIID